MAEFEKIEYNLPAFWVAALINGDISGFSDEDEAQFNQWVEATSKERGEGHWSLPSDESGYIEPSFVKYHDATNVGVLACDTYTYHWMKRVS